MGRLKKAVSKSLDKANTRLAAIKSIDPNFDFGDGNSKTNYDTAIGKCTDALSNYNGKLSEVDELYNIYQQKEKELDTISESMLLAVAAKYGKDSNEYEKAGGVRKSEKKKPTKKKNPA